MCPALSGGDQAPRFTDLCLRNERQTTIPWGMALRAQRPLLCLVTALLFAIGSVAHVHAAATAGIEMATPPMEASAPDDGMDCCAKEKAAHVACVAMCATAVAILSD